MLLELHAATTDYFRYTGRYAVNQHVASAKWTRVLQLAERAGITGVTFFRFKNRVATQVAAA